MNEGTRPVMCRDESGNQWDTDCKGDLEGVKLTQLFQSVSPQSAQPAIVVIHEGNTYPIIDEQA